MTISRKEIFIDTLAQVQEAVQTGKLIDSTLSSTAKKSYSLIFRWLVRPFYWIAKKDAFAQYRVTSVANALLHLCEENREYVTKDILQNKVLLVINTLDTKTKQKYASELQARNRITAWAEKLQKAEEEASKNTISKFLEEMKDEVLPVIVDEVQGFTDKEKPHLHPQDAGKQETFLQGLVRVVVHVVLSSIFAGNASASNDHGATKHMHTHILRKKS